LGLGDGLQPQTKAVAHPHRQRDDSGSTEENLP